MRTILRASGTVLCAVVFSALLIVWAVAYMLEGALDKALVRLVELWPED